jgi:hypothetical protein
MKAEKEDRPVISALTCFRCDHSWYPRSPDPEERPITCPNRKCRSPYWHRPRKSAPSPKTIKAA